MNRIFITAAAALAAAAVMVQAVPAEANSRDREIAIGLIGATAGFIVGNATAGGITVHRPAPPAWHDDRYRGPRYDRRYDPRYDRRHWRPAPQPAPRPELRRAGDPWSATWLRYCRETYRSFNERTGTFRGFDGRDHFCVMPEHLKPRGRFDGSLCRPDESFSGRHPGGRRHEGGTMTGILGQGALAAAMEKMVPAPGGVPDWETMTAAFPALAALDGCAQDPVHHAEGDAGTHTRMVLESLCRDPAWAETDETGRALLFWAAAFHDSGKPATSAVEDGRITSRGHSRAGSAIARECMRRAGVRLDLREEACALVATHMIPYHLFSNDDPRRQAIRISLSCRPRHLVMHATADVEGRICADAQELRDRIALSEAVFEEEGCLDGPYPFANDESRVAYFERDGRDPAYAAWEDPRCTMTFVCGLPGSGKDTWISRNMPDVPTVSLDAIREREGISPAGEQGRVVQAAFEEARIHLRAGRDFTWNATGVTRLNRGKALQIARDYGARTRIVYIETSPARLLEQNSSRRAAVPTAVIERLAAKLEPPMRWEAHDVEWLFDGSPVTPPGCARQPGPGFGG